MLVHHTVYVAFLGSLIIGGIGLSEAVHAGALEPAASPAPTMKTLEQVEGAWDKKLLANDGPDSCNSSRFTCVMGGVAVRDNETGLVWEQAPLTATHDWAGARSTCTSRTTGDRRGWRLPSVHHLASLLDPTNSGGNPDLPGNHPFDGSAQGRDYWSSTTLTESLGDAWNVEFGTGAVAVGSKVNLMPAWCVRGSMNADRY